MSQRYYLVTTPDARQLLAASLLMAGLLVAAPSAFAAPIAADLMITGSVELSTSIGQSTFSDGNVTQTGEIRTTQGGATTQEAFSTASGDANGVNDNSTTLPGTNPLLGTFTSDGIGIGYSTDLDAGFETGFNFNEGYDFVVAFGIDLENTSPTDTFTVTVNVNYSHVVDVGGADAFAEAGLDLELDNVDVLTSDVLSDTLNGDALNGATTGASGNTVADSGMFSFDVTLAPGATAAVGGTHQWEGGVSATGNSNVDISVDITIGGAACVGPNCIPPEADLSIIKTDGVTSAVPGESVTYNIVASNAGPSPVSDAAVTDTFPADLTCSYTSAAAGGATGNTAAGSGDLAETLSMPSASSVTYTATCDIDPAATGTLSNTATISSATVADPDTNNNSATDSDTNVSGPAVPIPTLNLWEGGLVLVLVVLLARRRWRIL